MDNKYLKNFEEAVYKYCEVFYTGENIDNKAYNILENCSEEDDFWDNKIFEDTDFSISKNNFVKIMNNIDKFELSDDGVCVFSKNQYYFNIDFFELSYSYNFNFDAIDYKQASLGATLLFVNNIEISDNKISLGISQDDLTMYEFVIRRDSYFDIYWHRMYKLVIESEKVIEYNEAKKLANAYIFNLIVYDDYLIDYSKLPILDYPEGYDDFFSNKHSKQDILFDDGLIKPISYFIKSKNEEDFDVKVIYLFKILEHIGPYVLKEKLINLVSEKIESLTNKPSIDYIIELGTIYYSNNPKSDSTNLLKTILNSCLDFEKLEKPDYIKKNGYDNINDTAKSIVNTRNKLVHAKSNYKDSGFECPDNIRDQTQFISMIEEIAIYSIKYYSKIEKNILGDKKL